MLAFIFDTIINIILSFISFIGGCVTSDTVAGTIFVPSPKKVINNNNGALIVASTSSSPRGSGNNIINNNSVNHHHVAVVPLTNSTRNSRAASQVSAAYRSLDEQELQERRVKLCKYFLVLTLFGIFGALAAWDRWPLLWLLRFQSLVVGVCCLAKGPEEVRKNDYLRIPMTLVPWFLAIDFFFFSA